MIRYWITTHWPPLRGDQQSFNIHICDGRQDAGIDLQAGDKVLIYEVQNCPDILHKQPDGKEKWVKHARGRGGIIAIAELTKSLYCDDSEPTVHYRDGTRKRWCWIADGRAVNISGFVPMDKAARIMKFGAKYTFRGFGKSYSGLSQISEDTYREFVEEFKRNRPSGNALPDKFAIGAPHHGSGVGGEGLVHNVLKEAVYKNPSAILGIPGLKGIHIEYPFETGDRADVILEDFEGRCIAVEVEDKINCENIAGMLQAIKYKYMLAVKCRRGNEEIRAFLVAHEIDGDVKKLCARYDVECFQVSKNMI